MPKAKTVKPTKLAKIATFRNVLILTIVTLVGVLAYNLYQGDGFFASPASINAVKVSTRPGASTDKGGGGATSKKVDSITTSQINQLKNSAQSAGTGDAKSGANDKKKAKEGSSTNTNIVQSIITGVTTAVTGALTGQGTTAVLNTAAGVAGSLLNNDSAPAVVSDPDAAGGDKSGKSGSGGDDSNRGGGNTPAKSTKNCGGGRSPMRVGLYYPTGAAMPDKPNERLCVQIAEDCSHVNPKPCHTIPSSQVVLPNGAGAEYTTGQQTASDGSNIDKNRKKNCTDVGGAQVPTGTGRTLQDGTQQSCDNGVWRANTREVRALTQADCNELDRRDQSVLTYKLVNGNCVPQLGRCRPTCQGTNRLVCNSSGKWEVRACDKGQTCVNGSCDNLPSVVENGKTFIDVTRDLCDTLPSIVPTQIAIACAAIRAGDTDNVKVDVENQNLPDVVTASADIDNSILSDAPGVVNIDTPATMMGCTTAITFTLVPCTAPLLAGPFGIVPSAMCRVASCVAGGYAGNKVGDAIYNITH